MLKPTENYILLKIDKEPEEKTESGIYLPTDTKTAVHQQGEVVSGGEFSKGTTVIFKRWAGEDISWKGKDYQIVHKTDVIAYESR